jgi:predicted transposase/invertase (TIGR01784 family)
MPIRIKSYKELTFTDDFMFCNILQSSPDICKDLVELILNRKVASINMPETQKSVRISPDSKGVRFDVYFEDEDTIYDIEMQTTMRHNIPRRSRYYQGVADINQIRSGTDYSELKNSYIIFISTFDMFGLGLPIYTFSNVCSENKALALDDGTFKVFINATSRQTNISQDLRNFLDYLLSGLPCSELTDRIENKLGRARINQDWEVSYMTLEDKYKEMFEDGKEEGLAEGEAKGRQEGEATARQTLVSSLYRNGLSVAEIVALAELTEDEVTRIVHSIAAK